MRRENLNILIMLDEWLEAGMSFELYKSDRKRGLLQTAGRACNGREVEIIWGSIKKEARRAAIIRRWGDPAEAVKVSRLEAAIQPDPAAYDFFHAYIVDDNTGRMLKKEAAEKYYASAIVLDAVRRLSADHHALKMTLGNVSPPKVWPALTAAVSELDRAKYPHDLPGNEKRLRERLRTYSGYESLIHGNFRNRNAAKVDGVNEAVIIKLLSNWRVLGNVEIAKMYNDIADTFGMKKISDSTAGNYRKKYDMETYAAQKGETAHCNRRAMQVKRSLPTAPLYFWTLDGWDVELLYQERVGGEMKYHHRPTVVVVLDPCGYYPVGFATGRRETPELIRAAVRNAINHTAELFGERYRAWQIQSDHYSIKTMAPVYGASADRVTPAKVRNAKAKPIEPWFGREMNNAYCKMMDNWSGHGVKSKNQPNSEVINACRHSLPDYNGVCRQVFQILADMRARRRDKYVASFQALPASDRLPMSLENFLYHFGAVRIDRKGAEIKNRLEGHGVIVTIDGVKHAYDCFDLSFRKHYAQAWTVKYDPSDTRRVLACNDDGSLRFMLEEKYIQPMALKDRKPGDSDELNRIREFNTAQTAYITDFLANNNDTVDRLLDEHLDEHPALNDTLAKHMLTDSRGQHKNNRNSRRLAPVVQLVEGEDEEINIHHMI
ncbi:MAG: hypothetical protein LBL04_14080 [Bacteroidales bacterium]|jgi:hypothetical protein|nr:hypothetical protein [Bacteroidales bacterium]